MMRLGGRVAAARNAPSNEDSNPHRHAGTAKPTRPSDPTVLPAPVAVLRLPLSPFTCSDEDRPTSLHYYTITKTTR